MEESIMNVRIFTAFLAALLLLPLFSAAADAAPQRICAEGVYRMGDSDAPKDARAAARQEAMRAATEQAGVYVESYTEIQNLTLTKDEVRMIAGSVLHIIEEEAIPEVVDGVWQYRVRLICEVDTSEVDVAAIAEKKAEIERLERERDSLRAQNNALRLRDVQQQQAREAARGTRLADTLPYTAIFDETRRLIERGQAKEGAEEVTRLIGDPRVTGDALAYAYCLRGIAYYEMGEDKIAIQNFRSADEISRSSEVYPLWRGDQYYALICERQKRWKDAAKFFRLAWEASDKTDTKLEQQLEQAESRVKKRRGGIGAFLGGIVNGVLSVAGALVGIG